ncbi:hypothetical protein NsoK4_05470 [Nitrosopumilus sp. K4]|uniref:hypothetical protein n=1 Tax=Nitrosopumilus sp. K4 TaxID=2795383 RepID=UPI001BA5AE72|nr:hypothetical protein [Nitrosopumilus sp. K4]QUC63914.1 hypothetical protein NsoK4_05470 [Nitrosopumilus sp. K4]
MDYTNLIIGAIIVSTGVVIVFVGNYFSKKIGNIHVVIYFMGAFVIFGGVLLLLLFDKPSIF